MVNTTFNPGNVNGIKSPCFGCKDRYLKEIVDDNGDKKFIRCHDRCERYKEYCEKKLEIAIKIKEDKKIKNSRLSWGERNRKESKLKRAERNKMKEKEKIILSGKRIK